MSPEKFKNSIRLAAVLCAAAVILLHIAGFGLNALNLKNANYSRQAQEDCIDGFFSAVSEKNEKNALRYVCNADSLGISSYSGEFQGLYNELFSGMSWTVLDIEQLNSRSCSASVRLELLSVNKVCDRLSERTMEEFGNKYVSPDSYDEFVSEELYKLMNELDDCYTETELTLRLLFSDGEWKLVLDESFADALLRS